MNESNRNTAWPSHVGPVAALSVGALVLTLVVLMDGQPARHGGEGAGVVTARVATGPAAAEGDTSVPSADASLRGRDARADASPEESAPTF